MGQHMNFSLTDEAKADDGYVYKKGLIFREGEYKDKNFTMTREEILEAEARFTPVPLDVEHVDNLGILNGKLGTLEAIKASDTGEELYGVARIPKWLNDLNKGQEFKVSCTWGREDKTLKKLAIVKNPRVHDAALMAAFSRSESGAKDMSIEVIEKLIGILSDNDKSKFSSTWDGKWTIQGLHDAASRSGAVCMEEEGDEEEKKADFISSDEAEALQMVHDLTKKYGAKCSFIDEEKRNALYSGEKTMTTWESIKSFFAEAPAVETAEDLKKFADSVDEKNALKDEIEQLKAKVEALTATQAKSEDADEGFSDKKEDAVNPEVEALKAELAAVKEAQVADTASKFANELIGSKTVPVQSEALTALFAQAIKDDAANGVVKFNDAETTRVGLLQELFKQMPNTGLTEEKLEGAKVANLSDDSAGTDKLEGAKRQAEAYAKKRNAEMARA